MTSWGFRLLPVLQHVPFTAADQIHGSAKDRALREMGQRGSQNRKPNRHFNSLLSDIIMRCLLPLHNAEYGNRTDKT